MTWIRRTTRRVPACDGALRSKILWPSSLPAWLCCVALIGILVSSASGQTVTYIHSDALGSVVAESDANGNVIKNDMTTSPMGKSWQEKSPMDQAIADM